MSDQRNRWAKGVIRHLRVLPDGPGNLVSAQRIAPDADHTLIVGPECEHHVETLRTALEPQLAGLLAGLSPSRWSPHNDRHAL